MPLFPATGFLAMPDFREFLFAALLKGLGRQYVDSDFLAFPRISIRGFIEGRFALDKSAPIKQFPRISIRGFIEGDFRRRARGRRNGHFREFLFAALLKEAQRPARWLSRRISANFYSRLY